MSYVSQVPPTHLPPDERFKRLEQAIDQLRWQLEGTDEGSPLSISSNKQFGMFGGAQRSLIFDPGFERNRESWVLGQGQRYLESTTLARSGHYCIACDPTSANIIAVANQFFPVDGSPGNVLVISGWARRSSGGSSEGQVLAGAYDRDDVLLPGGSGLLVSTATTLTTSYQRITANAVVPANACFLRFGFRCPTISSGEAYWDDVTAYFLPFQDQHSETAGPVAFTGTEVVLGTINIGSAQDTGLYHVVVQAFVTIEQGNATDTYQLRIRRDNTAGAVLSGSATGALCHQSVAITRIPVMGFDANPNTVTQNYVVTGQRLSGSGTFNASNITMLVSQRNIAL